MIFLPNSICSNAWHCIHKNNLKNWVAYLYSKAIMFPGTALFDAMAVLAMLKALKPHFLHLHAPAQSIMPPPATEVSP